MLILVRPQLADNIGMAARAMANFGLEHLRLVAPRDGWPNEKARIAASGANFIIDGAEAFPAFEPAFADLNWVCATTARQRDLAKPVLTPEQAVAEMRRRLAQGQRCGILFGPERNGLETGEIANADAAVMVPVNPSFASLNLAQAVLLLSYEWMKQAGGGTLGRVTTYEAPLEPGLQTRGSPPASRQDLTAFFEHIEKELDASGFFTRPGEAAERGAEPALHVRPHGGDGAGNPHLARNCQGAGPSQGIAAAARLSYAAFSPERCHIESTRHGHAERHEKSTGRPA